MQSPRHCLRHRHNGALPLPTYLTGHRQQHEYVVIIYYTFPCVLLQSLTLTLRLLATATRRPSHSPLPRPYPSSSIPSHSTNHTLIKPVSRLLHRRFLHRHRHKRSAMVRRRPQKLQRSRLGISRRGRRTHLRRRQRRQQSRRKYTRWEPRSGVVVGDWKNVTIRR